jgi:hypothetical protein
MLDVFAEKTGVLLMEHGPNRVTDDVISLFSEARRRAITFASHTTQIFQILDVTPFGVLKRRSGYKLPFEDEKETVKFIMKVRHDFKQTMMEHTIWGVSRAIALELEFDIDGEPYRLLFNEQKLRHSEGFGELRLIDFPCINCRVAGRGRMPDLAGATSKKQE